MARKGDKSCSKQASIYSYDISHLKNSNKVRFVYVLKGRGDDSGLVLDLKGEFLAPGCFMIPSEKDSEIKEVMKKWNVKHKKIEVLMR
ncbi:hypothetical protein ACFL96_09425 [Thermoproteota archaeon]